MIGKVGHFEGMSGYFGAVEEPKGPLIGKLPLSDVDELV